MRKKKEQLPSIEQLLQAHVNRRVVVLVLQGPEQMLLKGVLTPKLEVDGERINRYSVEKGVFQLSPKDVVMVTEERVPSRSLQVPETPPSRASAGYEVETR